MARRKAPSAPLTEGQKWVTGKALLTYHNEIVLPLLEHIRTEQRLHVAALDAHTDRLAELEALVAAALTPVGFVPASADPHDHAVAAVRNGETPTEEAP